MECMYPIYIKLRYSDLYVAYVGIITLKFVIKRRSSDLRYLKLIWVSIYVV